MSELEAMGISVQRGFVTNTADVDGVHTGESEATQLAFTLPKPIELQATFSKEGFADKLVKIFKKEIQAGDPTFDETVYVKTDTPELTAALLQAADVRASIARMVSAGGVIEVDGPFVKMELAGHHETDDADTITFVRALVG